MRKSVTVEGYRRFSDYTLGNLSRVNLLVGKNNCGKTSLLEAVHLLASGGDPHVLAGIAWNRGELVFTDPDAKMATRHAMADVSHLFHGHNLCSGASVSITGDHDADRLAMRVELPRDGEQPPGLLTDLPGRQSWYRLQFEGGESPASTTQAGIPVSEKGALLWPTHPHPLRSGSEPDGEVQNVQYISPDSLTPIVIGGLWEGVILASREDEVFESMRVLLPGLSDIRFLSGPDSREYRTNTGVVVSVEGQERRLPLGSYGDGMRRLLSLSLVLIQSEGGVLLVDEIDTGLHYSIMGDLWHFIVKAARQYDIQVFATTHSLDCVRGLGWLCENHPDLASEVSVQKIDPRLSRSVALDAEKIIIASNQDIEMR